MVETISRKMSENIVQGMQFILICAVQNIAYPILEYHQVIGSEIIQLSDFQSTAYEVEGCLFVKSPLLSPAGL